MLTRAACLPALCLALTGCINPSAADASARWYRGNLHTHSLWSDGNDVPEMVCDWYKSNGYHFVALSDHNILADHVRWMDINTIIRRGGRSCVGRYRQRFGDAWVETRKHAGKQQLRLRQLTEYRPLLEEKEKFLLIQSEEVTSTFDRLPVHMNVTNVQEKIAPPKGASSVRDVIRRVLAAVEAQSRATGVPMLTHVNHPNFGYAVTAEDLAVVTEERFYEVWNGHPAVHHRGDATHVGIERMWDIVNTLRLGVLQAPPIYGLATDDSHNYANQNPTSSLPGRGWVMVRSESLTPEHLIRSLNAGAFYASSGVELRRLDATETEIALVIEPKSGERYVTQFIGTLAADAAALQVPGPDIPSGGSYPHTVGEVLATVHGTSPRYRLTGDELYVRAVVTSSATPRLPVFEGQLKKAWTQPVGWRARLNESR